MFNIYLTEYNGMFLKHIAKALGCLLKYIYMALANLGIENVAVSIVIFTLILYKPFDVTFDNKTTEILKDVIKDAA